MNYKIYMILVYMFLLCLACIDNKPIDVGLIEASKDWAQDIKRIDKRNENIIDNDSLIVFVGSSTFDIWHDLQSDFPLYCTVNNGISGFCLNDIIYYYQQLVYKYNPKILVLYYGDNDIAMNKSILQLQYEQQLLFKMIQRYNSKSMIVLITIKHSPARKDQKRAQEIFNLFNIGLFAQDSKCCVFDINQILLKNGVFQFDKYLNDKLHINSKAYKELSDSLNVIFQKYL